MMVQAVSTMNHSDIRGLAKLASAYMTVFRRQNEQSFFVNPEAEASSHKGLSRISALSRLHTSFFESTFHVLLHQIRLFAV